MNKPFTPDKSQRPSGPPSGIVSWFIYHPVAGALLLMIVLLSGMTALTSLNQEVFPPFAPSQIEITVDIRGASPHEVEQLVVLKVEQALAGLEGIKRILATAERDRAAITIELTSKVSQDRMLNLIKSRVDAIDSFPAYAERPVFSAPEPTDPMMIVSLYGNLPLQALLNQGQKLEKALSALSGVSYARIQHLPDMQVSITTKPSRLNEYGLTLEEIASAINNHSLNLSTGDISTTNGRLQLRTAAQALDIEDFRRIPVKFLPDGRHLAIQDLAEVRIEPVKEFSLSRFNGIPAMTLDVRREKGVSLAAVSQEVTGMLESYQQQLGDRLQVQAWMDESREFTSRSALLLKNGITGFLLICLIMGMFIHWRVAFWTAVGIPVSIVGAMALLYFSGLDISLNAITLFGFLIAIGLIVDDALVIGESIHNQTENHGHSLENIALGANKVALPATFGALTTIAAFFPLTLTEGEMGSRMGSLGIVVICCLLASLLESKLILPGHLRRPPRQPGNSLSRSMSGIGQKIQGKASKGLTGLRQGTYFPVLVWVLQHPWKVLTAAAGIFTLTLVMVMTGLVKTSVLPDIADYEISGTFQLNPNLSPTQRDLVSQRLETSLFQTGDAIKQQYQLDYDPIHRHSVDTDNQSVHFTIEIAAVENAPFDAHEVAQTWRAHLPKLPAVESVLISSSPGDDEQVAIQLSGDNITQLEAAASHIKGYLAEMNGVIDVRDSSTSQSRDLILKVTAEGKSAGVTQRWLSEQVRASFYGIEAQRIQNNQQEWRVMVSFPKDHRNTLTDLREMVVALPNGAFAPLSTIATIEYVQNDTSILRIDARRSLTIYAGTVAPLAPDEVVGMVEENLLSPLSAHYPGVVYSIEGEVKESAESLASLLSGALLALFVIFALMAVPMRSYRFPLVILALAPLGIVGAVLGHWIIGIPLSLISLFGLVGLMGVLINNGLLLVDAHREDLEKGKPVNDAIINACLQRFRPVLLTSVTTFAGVMPLLWETDPEALWLVPIAVSLGAGVLVGTLLTLITLPAALILLDRNRYRERSDDNFVNTEILLAEPQSGNYI
ncbi:efflux RND transporter permease subunit [Hahella ganghwensis]|uniref:efflux RND transporter permease subunit n=1 Tax=Hahella ganghwensis TaxID=286420 RepID=UPI000362DDEE|nr:efflux RND transporter permease subunit [Hahella ganghwensis]